MMINPGNFRGLPRPTPQPVLGGPVQAGAPTSPRSFLDVGTPQPQPIFRGPVQAGGTQPAFGHPLGRVLSGEYNPFAFGGLSRLRQVF